MVDVGIGFLDRNVLHPMDQRILYLRERDESGEIPRQDESVEIETSVSGFDDDIISDEGVGQGECPWGGCESLIHVLDHFVRFWLMGFSFRFDAFGLV